MVRRPMLQALRPVGPAPSGADDAGAASVGTGCKLHGLGEPLVPGDEASNECCPVIQEAPSDAVADVTAAASGGNVCGGSMGRGKGVGGAVAHKLERTLPDCDGQPIYQGDTVVIAHSSRRGLVGTRCLVLQFGGGGTFDADKEEVALRTLSPIPDGVSPDLLYRRSDTVRIVSE